MKAKKGMVKKVLAAQLAAFCLCNGHALASDFVMDSEYYGSGALDVINAAEAYDAGITGQGVTVVVSDQLVNLKHPDFVNKTNSYYLTAKPGENFDWQANSHGTHVAGIIAAARNGNAMHGVAYDANIISIDKDEDKAVNKLDNNHTYIVNASWGNNLFGMEPETFFEEDEDDESEDDQDGQEDDIVTLASLKKIIEDNNLEVFSQQKTLSQKDALYVRSMGNEGHVSGDIAAWTGLLMDEYLPQINVTNLNGISMKRDAQEGAISGKILLDAPSNLAMLTEETTLAAPGANILSANSTFAQNQDKLFVQSSGTSMSSPVVAGVGALVLQAHPYMNGSEIGEVLLSTANKNVTGYSDVQVGLYDSLQSQQDNSKDTVKKINIYYIDRDRPENDEDVFQNFKDVVAKDDNTKEWFLDENAEYRVDIDNIDTYNIYTYVPLDQFIGQGVVDAGKAVKGLGSINMRRMSADNVKSLDLDHDGTDETKQAFYTIDTRGYDAVWSNDINEVQTDKISEDSSQEDLRARYTYYTTNFIDEESEVANDNTYSLISDYLKRYNEQVEESGLIGLHGGLIKSGEGNLTLTGSNTYEGLSIAKEGGLFIDGTVSGGAASQKNGILGGGGYIVGTLYNENVVQPGSYIDVEKNPTLMADKYAGYGDIVVQQLGIGSDYVTNTSLMVLDTAEILQKDGQNVARVLVKGDELVPVDDRVVLSSNGLKGSFANTGEDNSVITSDTLSTYVSQEGDDIKLHVVPSLNLDNPSAGVQGGFDGLNEVYKASAQRGDSDAVKLAAGLYGKTNGTARSALQQISGQDMAAGINRAQRFNLANATLEPRLVQVFSRPTEVEVRGNHLTEEVSGNDKRAGVVYTLGESPLEGGWLKYTHMWNYHDDAKNHGTILTVGYDKEVGKNKRLGVFGSYGDSSYANGSAHSDLDDWRLGVYGGFKDGAADGYVYVDYGWQRYDDKRYMSVFGDKFGAKHNGHLLEMGGEYRYDLHADTNKIWHVRPYANVQLSRLFNDEYAEDTTNPFGFGVSSATHNYAASELGVDLLRANGMQGALTMRVGYKHIFAGSDPSYNFRYLGGDGTLHRNDERLDKDLLTTKLQAEQYLGTRWTLRGEVSLEKGAHDKTIVAGASAMYRW